MTSALFPGAGVKMEHFQAALDPRKQELLEARFLGARVSDALMPLGSRYKTQKVQRSSPPSHIKTLTVDAVSCSSETNTTTTTTTTTLLVCALIFIFIILKRFKYFVQCLFILKYQIFQQAPTYIHLYVTRVCLVLLLIWSHLFFRIFL